MAAVVRNGSYFTQRHEGMGWQEASKRVPEVVQEARYRVQEANYRVLVV